MLRHLRNGVPHGFALAPLLFNIYTTGSRTYKHADDPATIHADGGWQTAEGVLNKDMATVGDYPQTWKLNSVLQKPCWQSSISTRKLNVRTQMPRSNAGQGTHVPPTPRVISRKVDITHGTLEAACWLGLGSCSNNIKISHFSLGPFNSRVLRSCLVPQCSHLPHWLCHQWHLANCDWMPASYTSRQSCYHRRHPTCWDSSQGTILSPARGSMDPGHLLHSALTCPSSGNVCISNRDTNLYPLHNHSSLHLTTVTEMRCTRRIIRLRTGFGNFRSCLHKRSMAASATCEWRHVFFQCPIRRPPHRSHGWWDNPLAAQHVPRDLVQPSSGLKELAQTMISSLCLHFVDISI